MSICPLEFRYGSNEMRKVFDRDNMLRKMIDVEIALLKALEECGLADKTNYSDIAECSREISYEEVDRIEREIGHDIMAILEAIDRRCGSKSRYIHYGATSNDIIDTAWALTLREALSIVREKLVRLIERLKKIALEHRDTLMVGRTHGQHALPITLGFKAANYIYEFSRSLERVIEAEKRIVRGKMAGAVGTMAGWWGRGLCVEEKTLSHLGLEPHTIATQVAPRDGYAELVSIMAILGSQIERLALEIRELMRPEIAELSEGVGERVGSSTMPQKANPVQSEKISGLARVLRGMVVASLENIPLWHERDLSNSSSERIIIPHTMLLIDEIVGTMIRVLDGLKIFPDRMRANLESSRGHVLAEALMLKLTDKGINRQRAHSIVMRISRRAMELNRSLLEEALRDDEVRSILTEDELKKVFSYTDYLGNYRELIDRAVRYAESVIERSVGKSQ